MKKLDLAKILMAFAVLFSLASVFVSAFENNYYILKNKEINLLIKEQNQKCLGMMNDSQVEECDEITSKVNEMTTEIMVFPVSILSAVLMPLAMVMQSTALLLLIMHTANKKK